MTPRPFVGLDLGQAHDYATLAILRAAIHPADDFGTTPPAYDVPHLQRFPLGLPYPKLVEQVVALMAVPALAGAVLVVDRTGVGRPVVDMLADRLRTVPGCRMLAVTITSGQSARRADPGGIRVPKKELVDALQALVSGRRLRVARSLPAAAALVCELESFRVRLTKGGREKFGAEREGQHDDLVLAVALAAWAAEQCQALEAAT